MGIMLVWILMFGVGSGLIAWLKYRSFIGWFLLGCLFGIFPLIIIILMPKKKGYAR